MKDIRIVQGTWARTVLGAKSGILLNLTVFLLLVNIIQIIGKAFGRERDRWLLWAPLALGIGLVAYFQWLFEPSLWALAIAPLLIIAAWFALHRIYLLIALVVPLLIVIGFNAGQIETKIVERPVLDRQIGPTAVTGKLIFTEVMPKSVLLTLKDPQIDCLAPELPPLKVRVRMQNKTLADVPPTGSLICMG